MPLENASGYNNPNGEKSDIDAGSGQFRTDHYVKKALIEARREQYFMPLSNSVNLPKNMGKSIKKYHYLPLLDDENINDQGIDAAGAILTSATFSAWDNTGAPVVAGTGWTAPTATHAGFFATEANALTAAGAGGSVSMNGGNLYGSSKDVGAISGKLPALTEHGGRKNRVGHKRKDITGSIEKFGFFGEYTQESLDFDTDAELMMHINREMINGATEMTEDALQIDLLTMAGIENYPGVIDDDINITDSTEAGYADLMRLDKTLNDNRTPRQTKVFTGTRLVDTKTIAAGRVMFIGSDMEVVVRAMTDPSSNVAFIPVQHYAAGGTLLNGEIGTVGPFRIVVVPEMLKWAGKGGDASGTVTHYETNDAFDVFPMLVVGEGSFSTIGFQTDGKTVKFKIVHKKPGESTADRTDPFGETGFMSIKWYYGFLLERPERLAVLKSSGRM